MYTSGILARFRFSLNDLARAREIPPAAQLAPPAGAVGEAAVQILCAQI